MSIDIEEPIPLRGWVRGTLTIQFAGAVVKRKVSLNEAHWFERLVAGKQSSDDLDWSSTAWFQWNYPTPYVHIVDPWGREVDLLSDGLRLLEEKADNTRLSYAYALLRLCEVDPVRWTS